MRVCVSHSTFVSGGGVESYLGMVIPELVKRGHEVSVFSERSVESNPGELVLSPHTTRWSTDELGVDNALRLVDQWHPELVFAHGLADPMIERRLLSGRPFVCFAHDYKGLCISGYRRHSFPGFRQCEKRFGRGCLAHFFPRRCGGLSFITMLRDYRNQSVRHQTLAQARRVLTHSSHMVRVLEICGIDPSRIRHIPHTARGQRVELPPPVPDGDPIRLVFVGRIVREKGLHLAISSLPMVSRALRREVCFEVLGSGPDQQRCERLAANVSNADVAVCFRGWLSEREVMEALRRQHLLLCPSIWPEPFGQVGLEGATLGLPSVAFDVGGISEWLVDGVNGALVSPRGDFSRRLAEGIIGAVDNPEKLECLRQGALKIAQKFTLSAHLDALDAAFAEAIRR